MRRIVRGRAGDKVTDLNTSLAFLLCFGPPFATDLHPTVCGEQADIHRSDRAHGSTADVDATVVTIYTQLKKEVPLRAFSTPSRRLKAQRQL